ncbi:MAG TPA: 4-hydroxy-3-methylbut-2-enyl diphosphate reductase [Flavisolibacter sp.]|nr:4-hydroxy-3-methylbut-2-enyl diphosphate reductase [Flavisolibacter sp.]
MKSFEVPIVYRSPLISAIKKKRKELDKMKRDFAPTLLDFGPIRFYLARHFGFCYGVENAIDIAFKTIEENPGKRIYLLSEMIHNPQVNDDLKQKGIQFLQDNSGKQLIPFEILNPDDIVLIPAFGTTLSIEKTLIEQGIQIEKYNTTCPFVEKVWNRSEAIANNNYTIIIHGKPNHEETRATFSHASVNAPSIVVKDYEQALLLSEFILEKKPQNEFYQVFYGQYTEGFQLEKDLKRIGVVNQTTMLATDTQAIADLLKQTMIKKYSLSDDEVKDHFADTRDTLCYATNDNQTSIIGLLDIKADLAIVAGGYNSSNTSHLVELCEQKFPTYFIENENKVLSKTLIKHFDIHSHTELTSVDFLPTSNPVNIIITSGASCPDAIVEGIIKKLAGFYPASRKIDDIIPEFTD